MKVLYFYILLSIISCSTKTQVYHPLKRLEQKVSFVDLKKKLSCDPPLISQWVQEKSEINRILIQYGSVLLTRSDVGSPDGKLEIHFKDTLCTIELSLMPEIYFSLKDKILLIKGHSGSASSIEAFDLSNSCEYLGQSSLDETAQNEIERWRRQSSDSKTCTQ
ncbi:MAG: hypothetical protein ACPGJV_07380 [Bacteriovoracaceae bacterium]